MKTRLALGCVALGIAASMMALPNASAETKLLGRDTPWRVFLVCNKQHKRRRDPLTFTPAPPEDWTSAEFDDSTWGRYSSDLFEAVGGYGFNQSPRSHVLCLRTGFGVADPRQVRDLSLTLEYRGGVAVFVNGRELARHHLQRGRLAPGVYAEAYPKKALQRSDGKQLRKTSRPADEERDRYEARIRKCTVTIPASALRKDGNVLALQLHSAEDGGVWFTGGKHKWSRVGLVSVNLSSRSGRGVITWQQATRGVTVWNAQPLETVAAEPGEFKNGFLWWKMTVTPSGLTRGDPWAAHRPIRTVAPRGGTCSGQIVVSGPKGLRGVRADMGPLRHVKRGTTIPEDGVRVRYAEQTHDVAYCQALMPQPIDGAPVQPVWVLVDVPRDQTPGWYEGELDLAAGRQRLSVPVQVLVSPWTLPEPEENATFVSMYQSPDTLAEHYKVPPLSDAHFALMEQSFQTMGKLGIDVLLVPVVVDNYLDHKHGLIRWRRGRGGYVPDYSAFERYLDLFIKHCGRPKVVTLQLWQHSFGCRSWFRGMDSKSVGPVKVTLVDRAGRMTTIEAPHFAPGGEDFWKTMIDGARKIVKARGCDDRSLLIGEAFDSRPLEGTVDFFKKVAPDARWQIYSHWIKEPGPKNGKLVALGGLETGLRLNPNGGGLREFSDDWPDVPERKYYVAQAHRAEFHHDSSPLTYRAALRGSGTLCRIGLDFWPIFKIRGRMRSFYDAPPNEGWLWRGHSPALTAPSRRGAVPTVRGQMLIEGMQDTEALIQLIRARPKATGSLKQRIEACLDARAEAKLVGNCLSQATISLDWLGMAAREYALAAELAGRRDGAEWGNPPKGNTR